MSLLLQGSDLEFFLSPFLSLFGKKGYYVYARAYVACPMYNNLFRDPGTERVGCQVLDMGAVVCFLS